MDGSYDVYLGNDCVGNAQVKRQGLYLQIDCRCRLSGAVIYRLQLACGEIRENLGILVPEGEQFCLTTRIPVKRLGTGTLSFRAVPRHGNMEGRFVPICPEEPFSYLHRLKQAYLEIRNGQPGARIP